MPETPYMLIPHITQGQFQKEVTANQAFNLLERSIAEEADLDIAGTGDITITDTQARSASLRLTGILTGTRTVIIPARDKIYLFENATSESFEVDIKTASGTSVRVQQGTRMWVLCDGVNCFDLSRELLDTLTTVTGTYTVEPYVRKIVGDTTSGSFTITLNSPAVGKSLLILKEAASNTLTIARGGSDTINGAATSLDISTRYQAILLTGVSATEWFAHRLTVA